MHTVATNNAAPVIAAGPVGPSRRRRRVHAPLTRRRQPSSSAVLLVAAFGAFLAFLDSTIVNVAFPDIQRHFHSDISDLSWMLNAYNIVFAAFLVAAGRLADLMGRKRVFILGVALFTVASGLCAIAESVGELVAFRVLQGIGAAVLVPASLGLVVEAFPAERRAHGVNLWGAAGAIAAGLGPPIGGALIEADGWRWVFLVNLPLGVFAVLAARRALVENRAAGRRRVPDVRGAVLLAFALGLLTLGLIKGPDWGWASLPTSGSLLAAAVAMVGFVMSSRHHPAPMVEPTLLRIQSFVAGTGLTAVASAGFYAYLLTHVLFLNYVWGYTLLEAGMAVAPAALVAAVVAAVLGRVADRHGYRFIVGIGALIWAASLLWYLKVVGSQPDFLGEWLPGQILQGIGVGATFPLLGSAALARLAKGGSYATASAVTGTIRQVGVTGGRWPRSVSWRWGSGRCRWVASAQSQLRLNPRRGRRWLRWERGGRRDPHRWPHPPRQWPRPPRLPAKSTCWRLCGLPGRTRNRLSCKQARICSTRAMCPMRSTWCAAAACKSSPATAQRTKWWPSWAVVRWSGSSGCCSMRRGPRRFVRYATRP